MFAVSNLTAHDINTSYSLLRVEKERVHMQLLVDVKDLQKIVARDILHKRDATIADVQENLPRLAGLFVKTLTVRVNGRPLVLQLQDKKIDIDELGNAFGVFSLVGACKGKANRLQLELGFFDLMEPLHKNLVKVQSGEEIRQSVLTRGIPHAEYSLEGEEFSFAAHVVQFIRLGMEHIFIGYDHILFLIGLILLGGSLLNLLKIVTAFTVAHSITLILAALQIVSIPSRLVESVIALSIAYIAIENFFIKRTDDRWIITFIFGLMHGFGFAGVLRELGLPANAKVVSLLSFNVGVELGQLVIVALCFPVVLLCLRSRWKMQIVYGVSSMIFILGSLWFVERAFGLDLPFL